MYQKINFIECTSPSCRFRFPFDGELVCVYYCPKCGSRTQHYSYEIQNTKNSFTKIQKCSHREYVLVLDNIRSTYNVGSIFRTADGFGIEKLHLCGITSTPGNTKFQKTSLGSESNINWESHSNSLLLCKKLKDDGYFLICLENDQTADDIFNFSLSGRNTKLAIVIGNEKAGIDPEILRICHKVISIPMVGIKESFNVSVALGIMLYHLMWIR